MITCERFITITHGYATGESPPPTYQATYYYAYPQPAEEKHEYKIPTVERQPQHKEKIAPKLMPLKRTIVWIFRVLRRV